MNNLQKAFAAAAPGIIMNLQRRNMEGYFYKDCKSMVEDILSKIPAGSSITWGAANLLSKVD